MKKIVIASNNLGKLNEIGAILTPLDIEIVAQGTLGVGEAEEPYFTFVENALAKARHAARASGAAALADDSGLCVEALGGDPGIYSARWAGETKDFSIAMTRIESELKAKGLTTSAAKFVCALSLALPSGEIQTFEGEGRCRTITSPLIGAPFV